MGYIYKITNLNSGNFYIGKTTKTIEDRYESHLKQANKNPKTILHKAISAIGKENFTIEIVEECSNEIINDREQFYISKLSPTYNMTTGGDGGSTTHGKKWITNGVEDRYINVTAELPEGWVYGRTKSIFNDSAKQKEFNSRVDRKSVGKKVSKKWKSGEIKFSDEFLQQLSERMSGERNPTKSPEIAKKISDKQKEHYQRLREQGVKIAEHLHTRIECPHCGKEGIISNMKRWHFDNCKKLKQC